MDCSWPIWIVTAFYCLLSFYDGVLLRRRDARRIRDVQRVMAKLDAERVYIEQFKLDVATVLNDLADEHPDLPELIELRDGFLKRVIGAIQ